MLKFTDFSERRFMFHVSVFFVCVLGIGLAYSPPSPATDHNCVKVSGRVTLTVENETPAWKAYQSLSELGVTVESVRSADVLFALWLDPGEDTGKLENDPHVKGVRVYSDDVWNGKEMLVFMEGGVEDSYAYELAKSYPGAQVGRLSRSTPRTVQVSVPANEMDKWITELGGLPFVIEAIQTCESELRVACKKFGGALIYDPDGNEYDCDLPGPAVSWADVLTDEKKECHRSNGVWKSFSSGCTNTCGALRFLTCTAAITEACDCGPNRCWYSGRIKSWYSSRLAHEPRKSTCVETPDWQHAVTIY